MVWMRNEAMAALEPLVGEWDLKLSWDSRGVARVFGMTWGDGAWAVSREDPDFHQRFEATITPDRIDMRVEASEDEGKTWRKDFDLIFERRPATAGAT
jgi:hypothetical protein